MAKKSLLILISVVLGVFLLLAALGWFLTYQHPFRNRVDALLAEAGSLYEIRACFGGWIKREMHCEVSVSNAALNSFVAELQLDEPLPHFTGETRLIRVPKGRDPCADEMRQKYAKAFGVQQWVPDSRHGFASVMLFYDEQSERGCLFLSIAYG